MGLGALPDRKRINKLIKAHYCALFKVSSFLLSPLQSPGEWTSAGKRILKGIRRVVLRPAGCQTHPWARTEVTFSNSGCQLGWFYPPDDSVSAHRCTVVGMPKLASGGGGQGYPSTSYNAQGSSSPPTKNYLVPIVISVKAEKLSSKMM